MPYEPLYFCGSLLFELLFALRGLLWWWYYPAGHRNLDPALFPGCLRIPGYRTVPATMLWVSDILLLLRRGPDQSRATPHGRQLATHKPPPQRATSTPIT